MKKLLFILLFLLLFILFTGCAEVSPHVSDFITSDPAGFWSGLWHGFIIEFSFIGSIFKPAEIAIYQIDNTGFGYNFGFVLGCALLLGGLKSSD
jgi:hypothetical protein